MVAKLLVLFSCLSVAFLGGCGAASKPATCVPGASAECWCPDGQHGAQTCTSASTYEACVCLVPTVDAGGLGGAGGTATAPISTGGQVSPEGGMAGAGGATIPTTWGGGAGAMAGATIPATSSGGAGGQASLPADAGTDAADPDGPGAAGDGAPPADTRAVDAVYVPPTPCGDGILDPAESCDDGNAVAGDGCSPTCRVEIGFKCSGSPSICTPTTCGDGVVEGSEGCDDGNTMPFDGCSADCQAEPNCNGDSCTSRCGDGIVLGEGCDDGNNLDGDGCSKDCRIEPGFTCSQPPLGDKVTVPVVYRDFRFHTPADFEAGVTGSSAVLKGMVETTLDGDRKPIYTGLAYSHIESKLSFAQWYRPVEGINHSTGSKMTLWNNGNGAYVNRYGANPLFFPVDDDPFTPQSERVAATIPPLYDATGNYPFDLDANGNKRLHNFSFTSEARYWFLYEQSKSYTLDFTGDDDVWVFVNKKLAVDLGGIHTPVSGTVTLDATTAPSFGLVDGKVYEVAVFQAERQTTGSTYKLTLTGFNSSPSVCSRI